MFENTFLVRVCLCFFALAACGADKTQGNAPSTTQGNAPSTTESVPAAARAALEKQAGGTKLSGIEHELEGGVDAYEGAWQDHGRTHEAKVRADGTLIELESSLPADEVPEAVRTQVALLFPNASDIEYVKKTFYVHGESINYEIELRIEGKREERLFTPEGKPAVDPTDEGETDEGDEGDENNESDDDNESDEGGH